MRNIFRPGLILISLAALAVNFGCDRSADTVRPPASPPATQPVAMAGTPNPIIKTNAQWKKILTPNQYYILCEKGTEPPYENAFWNNHAKGIYVCAACGHVLYSSSAKYNSHTGWPSFWQPMTPSSVERVTDPDGQRTEILCPICGSHLGHEFKDGPAPTGNRYCMDSGALKFIPAKSGK